MTSRGKGASNAAKSILVVGKRMKRGACECHLFKEENGSDGISPLKMQKANISYISPGQALLVNPQDMILRPHKRDHEAAELKGAIKADNATLVRWGNFARKVDPKQLCPHRFICPRCPWQHIDPTTGPVLKQDTAKMLVDRTLREALPLKSNRQDGGGQPLTKHTPTPHISVEWLDPLSISSFAASLRARSVTFHFGVDVSGAYAMGAPISDLLSGARGVAPTAMEVVEPIEEKCLILSPSMREVAKRVQKLWIDDKSFRRASDRTLVSMTLTESAATKTLVARLVIKGTELDDNALRTYSDPPHQLSKQEGKLVDEILKGSVTCEGGVYIDVVIANTKGTETTALNRQLYPAPLSGHDHSATMARDRLVIVTPASIDGSKTLEVHVPCALQVHGAGQGVFRYSAGLEVVVSSAMALAATGDQTIDTLLDFPTDTLSEIVSTVASASGLWANVMSASDYLKESSFRGDKTCLLTRLYGGSSGSARRSAKALMSVAPKMRRVVAICEDSDALCSLVGWLQAEGLSDKQKTTVTVGIIDVDPMSHHFSAVVCWDNPHLRV